jgi:hypothetical protein
MGDFLNIAVAAYGSRVEICSKSFGIKLAERVEFEITRKRSFNNIERTAGTVEQWKTVASSDDDLCQNPSENPFRPRTSC